MAKLTLKRYLDQMASETRNMVDATTTDGRRISGNEFRIFNVCCIVERFLNGELSDEEALAEILVEVR